MDVSDFPSTVRVKKIAVSMVPSSGLGSAHVTSICGVGPSPLSTPLITGMQAI